MHHHYIDLLSAAKIPPLWWDENGTPRFAEHHPNMCPDIYADEVVLVVISCQGCGTEFPVQMSWSQMDAVRELAMRGTRGFCGQLLDRLANVLAELALTGSPAEALKEVIAKRDDARAYEPPSLAQQVRAGTIHYGDPPNTECCPAGATMNCWDLRVVEFWARGFALRRIREPENKDPSMAAAEYNDWTRVPELEIELPDATDPERLERV